MRLIVKLLLLLGCWCSLWFFPALATAVPLPEAHTVRVGWYPIKGLQDGTDNISLNGYNYEYLQQVAQYTNWRYQFVFGSWSQLDAQLKAGQIDILGNIGKIPGRENEYSFCAYPNGSKRMQLVCLQKNKQFSYDDFTAFKDASVATMTSPFVMMQLEELQKERQLNFKYYFYATNNDVIEALEDGTADLAMLSDMNDLANCKIVYQWEKTPFYFVVNKEKPQILAELNAAMKMLQSADRFLEERLFRRYFGNNQNSMGLSLTSEEQAYIEQRKTPLRFYLVSDFAPLSYLENGQAKGVFPECLDLLSKKTGLSFSYHWVTSYAELQDNLTKGEADLIPQITDRTFYQQMPLVKRLQPFYTLSCGLVSFPEKASRIEKVGILDTRLDLYNKLQTQGYEVFFYKTTADCLQAVVSKNIDAAAISTLFYEQLNYHAQYEGLVFHSQPVLDSGLCILISATTDPRVFSILTKALGSINQSSYNSLVQNVRNNIRPQYTLQDYLTQYRNLLYIIVFLIILVLFLIVLHQRQREYESALEKANAARTSFFNNLSHDMRTPLTGILGYTELGLQEQDCAVKQDYLNKINSSGKLLLGLVNDTLSLAKLESGYQALNSEPVAMQEFLDRLIITLAPLVQKNHQDLRCHFYVPKNESILIDKLKFQDVLLNLLSNAIKYTPNGGQIDFTIQHAPGVTAFTQLYYQIIIQDNGIGIHPEFIPHMFEAFTQENDPVQGKSVAGTGLGLAIVKKTLNLMRAEITVESTKGKGSCFTILLPVTLVNTATPVAKVTGTSMSSVNFDNSTIYGVNLITTPCLTVPNTSVPVPMAQDQKLSRLHVLMCEDNPINREIISKLLLSKGVTVTTAIDGEEGVHKFTDAPPDTYQAILMDIQMPKMDGYAATNAIRNLTRQDAKTIPILAMTANAYEEDVQKCLAAGMNAHLSKPVDSTKLFATLTKYAH